ncbi:hypothetical protein LOC51_17635 [Rubrivivax sp. JA1024]|nr:hypothetical protein [Rubrivivax sp. JA1024]
MFVSDLAIDHFCNLEARHPKDADRRRQIKSNSLLPSAIDGPSKLIQLINGSHF